jgi:hypothetical protein
MYFGVFLLAMAIVIQVALGQYGSRVGATAAFAHDLFLDYLPIVDLTFVIVGCAIATWVVAGWLLITSARRLVFGIKAIALFIICRAFFTSLTHIGPYPGAASPNALNTGWWLYHRLTFPGDFFFSGHTAFPFLVALLFWDDDLWRPIFLGLAVFFGATMLLSHTHYSIDVFAAPFMVFGTYRITEKLFPKDRALM